MWVAAAAKASTALLMGHAFEAKQLLRMPQDEEDLFVSVASAALLSGGKEALGVSFCQSNVGLDLTKDLEV